MRILSLFKAAVTMAALTACSQNGDWENGCSDEAQSVIVSVADIVDGDADSRVAVDVSSASPSFPFTEKDTLGIFPSVGDQVSFPLSGSAGSTTTTFNGGGWGLKSGATYYAYMPFSRTNFASYDMKKKLAVSFLGQAQDNVNNTNGIGSYVYMTTEGTRQTDGTLRFQLRHVGALARVGFSFPEAATYTKVCILAESDVFATTGTLDLESNSTDVNPVTRSDRMVLSLKNVRISAAQLSSTCYFYLMFPPCDCSGQTLKILLVDSFGNTYSAKTRVGKNNNFLAGHYYGFTATENFVKTAGTADNDGGNIGFLVETDEMANEDVNLNF